jgi:hypothetical protein
MKLNFEYNPITDEITIEGNRFSGDFFRWFNVSKPGQVFRLVTVERGNITIEALREGPAPPGARPT